MSNLDINITEPEFNSTTMIIPNNEFFSDLHSLYSLFSVTISKNYVKQEGDRSKNLYLIFLPKKVTVRHSWIGFTFPDFPLYAITGCRFTFTPSLPSDAIWFFVGCT